MLDLLLALHERQVVSDAELSAATGLDLVELSDRIGTRNAAKSAPWVVDSVDADGTMRGKTPYGLHTFTVERALDPATSPLEIAPTAEEATVDLAPEPGRVEVLSTVAEVAARYDAAVQSAEVRGGAMDRAGQPAEPLGKGEAAYHEAARGKKRR